MNKFKSRFQILVVLAILGGGAMLASCRAPGETAEPVPPASPQMFPSPSPVPTLTQYSSPTYYVDCSAAANGNGSQEFPWNTVKTPNLATFLAGDSLLFKRGATCEGMLGAPAARYRVAWTNAQNILDEWHIYNRTELEAGINLADDFQRTPFSNNFHRIDDLVFQKQAIESAITWRETEAQWTEAGLGAYEAERVQLLDRIKRAFVPWRTISALRQSNERAGLSHTH